MNCRSWVVDPKNHERLLPVGAIGELLLEGPSVAGGYIGEPEQTAAVFVDQPPWLKAFNDKPSRAYKTGDLVKYDPDGILHFVARKDNQVKIRGQRLELGEVEFHIRAHYRRPIDVTVELAVPEHQFREPFLVAFIYTAAKESPSSDEILAQPSSEFRSEAQATQDALSERLPVYMVPTLYLPLQRIPLSANDKINRHVLRQLAAKLSLEDFLSYSARATTKPQEADDKERQLQLATSATSSIPTSASLQSAIAPFALMSDNVSKEALAELAAAQCGIPASHIEDVYHTTPLQEGLIALTTKRPGQCVATFQYELAEGVETGRFVAAWNATVAANAILRTRIIQSDSLGFLQVIARDLVSWRTFDDEQAYETHFEGISMGLATQLVDFALIQPRNHVQKGFKFHLTLHHALYDGGSLPRLMSQVQSAYNGETSEFEELTAPIFPTLPSPKYSPDPSKAHDVEGILPTTSIQSSMIKEKNITYSRLQISTQVDWLRLEEACRALVRKHASLRTVFVPYRDDIIQVVLRKVSFNMKRLECDGDLWEYSTKWCTEDDHILVVRMTHTLYDGGSFPLISKNLTSAQSQNSREMHKFWREYLDGSEMSKFNMLPPNYTKAEFEFGPIRKAPLPRFPDGITMTSLVKAAWSVDLAKATKRKDVVFGHLINGRDIPLTKPDAISGPCITISPFRVSIRTGWSVRDMLNHVQNQYTRSMPYTNSPDTEFGSIVTHEDANIDLSGSVDAAMSEWETMGFGLPHFNIITYPRRGHLWVKFAASNHKIHPSDVELLMDQFCEPLAQFSEDVSQPLRLGLD
ncbi:hypothetical protein F4782DRAFT_548662 [Xylaria castorea]|nr:hypothetical protein F4782DRAFT_548662 [Xylaria castorea]